MTKVAGLDLSLTATGLATMRTDISDTGIWIRADHGTITSTGRRADTITDRAARLNRLESEIAKRLWTPDAPDLVVLEGPSVMSKGGSNWDRAGFWWKILHLLIHSGVPVAVAAPTTIKKFAAGKGNADKAAVAVGMSRLWPDITCRNDNEWDALALAHMGAQHLGLPVTRRAHHAETLTKVEWPHTEPVGALL